MRDALSDVDPVASAVGRWHALDRGWQATALGFAIVTVLTLVGP